MNLSGWLRLIARLEREDFRDDITLSQRIDQAKDYVDNRLYRAEVVDPLPLSAPAGMLLVTPGDTHVYVGAGDAPRPLRKIPTLPL